MVTYDDILASGGDDIYYFDPTESIFFVCGVSLIQADIEVKTLWTFVGTKPAWRAALLTDKAGKNYHLFDTVVDKWHPTLKQDTILSSVDWTDPSCDLFFEQVYKRLVTTGNGYQLLSRYPEFVKNYQAWQTRLNVNHTGQMTLFPYSHITNGTNHVVNSTYTIINPNTFIPSFKPIHSYSMETTVTTAVRHFKCECGLDKTGGGGYHSSWCPKSIDADVP